MLGLLSNLSAGATTIMPLGDSITQASPGYRQPLQKMLKDAGIDVTFVGSQKGNATDWQDVCEGHGGFTIGPGASVADKWTGGKGNLFVNLDSWLGSSKPDYILLYVGVNDFCNLAICRRTTTPPSRARVD